MDICEPTLLRVEDRPELQGLVALLCSYTSRTLPRLPHPLSKCVLMGHEYRLNYLTPRFMKPDPPYIAFLSTQFEAIDSSVNSVISSFDRGPIVYDGEKRVRECARLRIERLEQLLKLRYSDSEM